jgi:hypothetical protein
MRAFAAMPLLLVMLIAYNGVVFIGSPATLDAGIFSLALMSGAEWTLRVSDLLVMLGLVLLYVEIFKSTRTSVSAVINHTLSMLVFVLFLVEFIVVAEAGTSTFLILALMSLIDVIAGFTVTIVAARRDFSVGETPPL